jgi:hypothetical protein
MRLPNVSSWQQEQHSLSVRRGSVSQTPAPSTNHDRPAKRFQVIEGFGLSFTGYFETIETHV